MPPPAAAPGLADAGAGSAALASVSGGVVGTATSGILSGSGLAAASTAVTAVPTKEAAPMSTIPGLKNQLIVDEEEKLPKFGFKVEREAELGEVMT